MSQIFKAVNGGGAIVDSVTGTNGVTASPTTGNVVVSGVNATTSSVGVASFNPANFTVSVAGQVSLITSQAPYINVPGTSQSMAVNTFYIANNAGLVTFTPPATCAVGTVFGVAGAGAGGWSINLAANSQTFNFGSTSGTTAVASNNRYDCVQFVCTVANTTFSLINSVGNPSVT